MPKSFTLFEGFYIFFSELWKQFIFLIATNDFVHIQLSIQNNIELKVVLWDKIGKIPS